MTEHLVGYPLSAAPTTTQDTADGPLRAGPVIRVERLRADDPDRTRLEARVLGAGPHVEAVLDVGTAANGDLVIVLPALAARLPDLLEVAGWPTEGEAVTVLIPLLDALDHLHEVGVTHGDLRPGAVRFDERGAPVLCAFDHAVLRRHGGAAFEAARRRDLAAAIELVRGLLRATGPRLGAAADQVSGEPAAMIETLFALAEPVPVRLDPRAEGRAEPDAAGRVSWPGPPFDAGPADAALDPVPARIGGIAPTPRADADRSLRTAAASRLRAAVEQRRALPAVLRRGAWTVRPRVWGAAAASVALLVAALVLLPGRGADAISDDPSTSTAPVAPRSTPHATATRGRAERVVAPRPDSPETAAAALLAARAACLAGSGPACIEAVDAAGSPVDIADRAATAAAVTPVLPPDDRPRVLSFRGDSAVLDVHGYTVLAVREPDRWRLRDVIAPPD